MELARMTSKGQLTVPVSIRSASVRAISCCFMSATAR